MCILLKLYTRIDYEYWLTQRDGSYHEMIQSVSMLRFMYLSILSVVKTIESRWDDNDRRKPKYSEKNLSQPHFAYHKFLAGEKQINFWSENLRSRMKKHRWQNNIKIHLTEILWECVRWTEMKVRSGAERKHSVSLARPAFISLLCASPPLPPPPPRNLSRVFRLYFSFFLVCVTGVDRQETGIVIDGVDSRLRLNTIYVHSFPDPTVMPQAIQWRILCGDSDVPSTFHSAIKAANLLTCRRVNGWQRQKFLPCSGFHELQKHNTK